MIAARRAAGATSEERTDILQVRGVDDDERYLNDTTHGHPACLWFTITIITNRGGGTQNKRTLLQVFMDIEYKDGTRITDDEVRACL